MALDRFLGLLLLIIPVLLLSSSSSSQATARDFNVGGKDGWVVKPSEDYSHWAQRNRFQVNDTLHFKYKKGSDSVLVVKKEDYDSCNTKNPKRKMDGGDSIFKLNNSGLFFFINGNADNCKKGQKLIVLVMAVRHPHPPAHAPPSPSPAGPQIHYSALVTPAPSPSKSASSVRGGVGFGVGVGVGVWVVLIFTGFAGLV